MLQFGSKRGCKLVMEQKTSRPANSAFFKKRMVQGVGFEPTNLYRIGF
jgi:hypothetical protein